eukprot:2580012-Pyramimonas_sp.AAC.1
MYCGGAHLEDASGILHFKSGVQPPVPDGRPTPTRRGRSQQGGGAASVCQRQATPAPPDAGAPQEGGSPGAALLAVDAHARH